MRAWLSVLLVVAAVAVIPVFASDEDACDMKSVQKMRYCENEDRILEKSEIVSGQKYYVCESCGVNHAAAGKCPDCEEALVEKVSAKNACKHCLGSTVDVEVCVKKAWACEGCETLNAKGGECPTCEEALIEQVVHSLVVYQCPECDASSYVAGKCTTEDCEAKGKALVKTCTLSGEFPHGGSAD